MSEIVQPNSILVGKKNSSVLYALNTKMEHVEHYSRIVMKDS